ncbi:MAG: glycerophosphodiester phosphodiesterase family protein, partial [Hyphomicrobiales bacterium]
MTCPAPDWLTARPIAHRGLHDALNGVVENSIAAARAAIAASYGVECDVQRTKDGDLVVFHDDTLERLTSRDGRVCDF